MAMAATWGGRRLHRPSEVQLEALGSQGPPKQAGPLTVAGPPHSYDIKPARQPPFPPRFACATAHIVDRLIRNE